MVKVKTSFAAKFIVNIELLLMCSFQLHEYYYYQLMKLEKPEDDVEREDDSGKSQKHFGRLTGLTTTFLLAWLICGKFIVEEAIARPN